MHFARVDDMRHSAACDVSFPLRGRLRRTSAHAAFRARSVTHGPHWYPVARCPRCSAAGSACGHRDWAPMRPVSVPLPERWELPDMADERTVLTERLAARIGIDRHSSNSPSISLAVVLRDLSRT